MLDPNEPSTTSTEPAEPTGAPAPRKRAPRKTAAKTPTEPQSGAAADTPKPRKRATKKATAPAEPKAAPAKAAAPAPRKRATKQAPATATPEKTLADAAVEPTPSDAAAETAKKAARTPRKRTGTKAAAAATEPGAATGQAEASAESTSGASGVLFMAPQQAPARPSRSRSAKKTPPRAPAGEPEPGDAGIAAAEDAEDRTAEPEDIREAASEQAATGARRRRRRGRRGRGGGAKPADDDTDADEDAAAESTEAAAAGTDGNAGAAPADGQPETEEDGGESSTSHRRRRRRRSSSAGTDEAATSDDPPNTVTHVRESRPKAKADTGDGVKGVKGSTRLEAKRQRRKDGRDTGRRRAPILTEAEFLARREAVDRVMAVRQNGERTQIAVLEDDVLVEHYVTRASATSYVGNVYLGRVQNVLPSMEAAFIDIGKGRNGVLYAGEVNWDAAGLEGKSRAIEQALKSGDSVLVQVTKDPIGHKGARLTSQISLPGRFVVYVPGGGMTGISRRLPDTERHRLKAILKKLVPDDAGVIVRTAAEGASEEDLTRDVERLTSQWAVIEKKAKQTKSAPALIHGEPDLAIRVVRDVFNEDFKSLVVQGEQAWETVSDYLTAVAPDLAARSAKHVGNSDLFHDLRVDEQLMKALDRKVWLPSGGSLVIDRTEAMTVVDVNTGKFVGAGGNLEQTVTRNNIEAAEEIVRQLRLRDVGGIIVIDFIDMVLESNRELVLRRLTECLGRDRTKHQVAEVTSLGLVQMTRKRVGEGLLEAFSEPCEVCKGRGVIVHAEPVDAVDAAPASDNERSKGKQRRSKAAKASPPVDPAEPPSTPEQRQAASAAIAAIHRAAALEEAAAAAGGSIEDLPEETVEFILATPVDESGDGAVGPGDEPEVGQPDSPDGDVGSSEPVASAETATDGAPAPRRRRRAASRPAGPPVTAAS